MTRWSRVDGDALHRIHGGELYNRPVDDPARVRVDLRGRRNGFSIPVFDQDGFRVRRRIPSQFETSGALVDLRKADRLFSSEDHPMVDGKSYHLYPLAFTKSYGNVQAKTTLRPFDTVLDDINQTLTPAIVGDNDDSDHDHHLSDSEDEAADRLRRHRGRRGAPILLGTHSQIYNAISHRVRDQARFHYVQLGMATSAMSATMAIGAVAKRRFTERKRHCNQGLPHQRYANAVQAEDQPQDLRIEQTFTLEVNRLRPEHKTGR